MSVHQGDRNNFLFGFLSYVQQSELVGFYQNKLEQSFPTCCHCRKNLCCFPKSAMFPLKKNYHAIFPSWFGIFFHCGWNWIMLTNLCPPSPDSSFAWCTVRLLAAQRKSSDLILHSEETTFTVGPLTEEMTFNSPTLPAVIFVSITMCSSRCKFGLHCVSFRSWTFLSIDMHGSGFHSLSVHCWEQIWERFRIRELGDPPIHPRLTKLGSHLEQSGEHHRF